LLNHLPIVLPVFHVFGDRQDQAIMMMKSSSGAGSRIPFSLFPMDWLRSLVVVRFRVFTKAPGRH
jgi:hypothetical protein